MTFNWAALGISALGAILGGAVGAIGAGYSNRPLGGPALIGAALGAIVASVASPKPAAASPAVATSSPPAAAPAVHALTAADSGATVAVRVGDTLTLTQAIPAAVEWKYQPTAPVLTYGGSTAGAGSQTDTWTASQAGTTTLASTGGAAPVAITVVVSGAP